MTALRLFMGTVGNPVRQPLRFANEVQYSTVTTMPIAKYPLCFGGVRQWSARGSSQLHCWDWGLNPRPCTYKSNTLTTQSGHPQIDRLFIISLKEDTNLLYMQYKRCHSLLSICCEAGIGDSTTSKLNGDQMKHNMFDYCMWLHTLPQYYYMSSTKPEMIRYEIELKL